MSTASGLSMLMQAGLAAQQRIAEPFFAAQDDIIGQMNRRAIEHMVREDAVRRLHASIDAAAARHSYEIAVRAAQMKAHFSGRQYNRSLAAYLRHIPRP